MPLKPPFGAADEALGYDGLDLRLDAVETSVGQTPSGVFNVKSYGATGDGSTDDYAAIMDAIDALPTTSPGGGTLYFPPGNYMVSNTLQLPALANGGILIKGAGTNATRITWTGGANYLFKIGTGTGEARWTFIEDMDIRGNASSTGIVLFDYTRFCGLRRCVVANASAGVGVVLSATATANYFNLFEHVQFTGSPIGIQFGDVANSNWIRECWFGNASTRAIWINGGDTNRITSCEFNGGITEAIKVEGTCSFNKIVENHFDGPTVPWNIQGNVSLTKIEGNTGSNLDSSTDSGLKTWRSDLLAATLPTIASATSLALRTPAGNNGCFLISGTSNITSITATFAGHVVRLIFTGTASGTGVTDGSNLKLNGNLVYTPDDTIQLVCDGTNWYELSRSVN